MSKTTTYDASNIKVLKGLEAVRKRPGMYIGDTEDSSGLHHMIFEILDNSIDEALAGFCSKVSVTVHQDGSVTVKDNGRGMPIDMHKTEGKPAAEIIMTVLHAGGKFDQDVYAISGGLHGVGVSVVNALSTKLDLKIIRDNKIYTQTFLKGDAQPHSYESYSGEDRGTEIRFYPDSTIFANTVFQHDIIRTKLREIAYLNPVITVELHDENQSTSEVFSYSGGLHDFLSEKYAKDEKVSNIICIDSSYQKIQISIAMLWCESPGESTLCFTNNIPQQDGGTHLAGFRSGVTRTLNSYMEKEGFLKKFKDINPTGEDIREGLRAILSVKAPDPRFSSQTKDKLVTAEIRVAVDHVVSQKIESFLLENPQMAEKIVFKVHKSFLMREASKRAREVVKKSQDVEGLGVLPGKLAPCQTKDPALAELYLVEGDSAGGSAKQARDRFNQAVLPLKGKILNIEKAKAENIVKFEEISKLIVSFGCGWGNMFNSAKLRYHKIVIMTDADVDGAHIRCLLLTLIFRHMQELVEKGHIYIAQPPLYSIKQGKSEMYVKDDAMLEDYYNFQALDDVHIFLQDGSELEESEVHKFYLQYRKSASLHESLSKHYPKDFIDVLYRFKPFDFDQSQIWWDDLLIELNKMSLYEVLEKEEHYVLVHHKHHAKVQYDVPLSFFSCQEYLEILEHSLSSKSISGAIRVTRKNKHFNALDFNEAASWLLQEAKDSVNLKRYKGLGEMNPDQLWHTTMNPESRRLLQVTIEDCVQADKLFSILMGEDVAPRKQFIVDHALYVRIDV